MALVLSAAAQRTEWNPTARRRSLLAAGIALVAGSLGGCGRLIPSGHQTTEAAALPAGGYRLDPDHTAILFKVDHLGFSTYVGRFNRVTGTLDFDPVNPAASSLTVEIDMASVDTPNEELDDLLRGPGWFEVDRFPAARFVSRSVEVAGPASGRVHGDLTLHGVTAPVTLEADFRGGAYNLLSGRYTLGFAAKGLLKRSAFGIADLVPAVGDAVILELHAEFLRIDG
jgi:polyisoprenoid-binding protein YceI